MYIIEKIIRLYSKLIKKDDIIKLPDNTDEYELEDVITCKHNFMPIDSTGNILACSKCGYVITKKRLENNVQTKSQNKQVKNE